MAYLFYLATLLRLLVSVHDDDHGQRQGVHLEIQLTHLNSRRIIKSAEYDHRNKLITATNCTSGNSAHPPKQQANYKIG